MSVSNVKSQLARLLARENIEIRHGEFRTASFDVQNRVLRLPMWKDMGKDVYDLLVGHEVGHALYTPAEGWHESIVDLKLPRSYVNVVEDIRIEKKVQSLYPGLVPAFLRGYKTLVEDNFFGTKDRDMSSYKLIDRINIRSKVGTAIPVEFNEEETVLLNKALAVSKWSDVLAVCAEILAYTKENETKEEELPQDEQAQEQGMDMPGMGDEDDDTGVQEDSEPSASESSDQETGSSEAERNEESTESEGDPSSAGVPDSETEEESETAETDEAFRGNEESLLEDLSGRPGQIQDFTKDQLESMIHDYKSVAEKHQLTAEDLETYKTWNAPQQEGRDNQYKQFLNNTKAIVNVMAKEFEMRKAAFQYSRAKTSATGSIDPTKLYSYKYNDDIFNRVTQLADAKNHGLVMYIDFSGSMYSTLHPVMEQLICLTQFCRKVNIPFEVYSFTTGNAFGYERSEHGTGYLEASGIMINEILSSKMKKAEYNRTAKMLWEMAVCKVFEGPYHLGATPLIETIIAAHKMVPAFQKKHALQKVTTVFLTDGEATSVSLQYGGPNANVIQRSRFGIELNLDGKKIDISRDRAKTTTALLNSLRESTGSHVLGFFVPETRRDVSTFVGRRCGWDKSRMAKVRSEAVRNGSAKLEEFGGYDELYVVMPSQMVAKDDDFEVEEGAKKGALTKAFKKFAGSKKANRIIMSSFAKKVA